MSAQPACPKCDQPMEPGFVVDRGHGNARLMSTWVAGKPERSFWTGLKTSKRANLEVLAYRCPDCGLLESYALKPPNPKE